MTTKKPFIVVLLMLALTWASAAMAQDQPPPISGRVTLTIIQAGLVVGGTGGHGVLTFNGKRYPFKIGGVGIGVLGGAKVHAEGLVYNLSDAADFSGTYVKGQTAYALGGGEGALWLQNTNGVVLKLDSTTKGAVLSFSGEGLVVTMGKGKKAAKKYD